MHISAKDKATGKENKITIKSNGGLTEAEIQKMVREAEENAESDRQQSGLIEARNGAESALHEIRRETATTDGFSDEQVATVKAAIERVEGVVGGEDAEAIKTAVTDLYQAYQPWMEKKMAGEQSASQDNSVVDAEFKEAK